MAKPPRKLTGSPSPEGPTSPTKPSQDPLSDSRVDLGHPASPGTGADPISTSSTADIVPGPSEPRTRAIVSPLPDSQPQSPPPIQAADSPLSDTSQHPVFIDSESANLLKKTPATTEGIRYDKHKKAYVEMDGGLVMVRHDSAGYRQTHAQESIPSGERVEQIPGSSLWRQVAAVAPPMKRQASDIPPEGIAHSSKQARLADEAESEIAADASALAQNLYSQEPGPLDLSAGQWKNWGKTTPPPSGASIEIDGKHYAIVAQHLRPDTALVYLQHPGFAPGDFDAFDQMLRNQPLRQPKWALKRDGQWRVVDNHPPFSMAPSQYVASAFSYLSPPTASAIARSVFNQVRRPEGLDAHGLSLMALIFRNWLERVNDEIPRRTLADPLLLLPKLPTQPDNLVPGGILTLPPRATELLQRVDFEPQHFPLEWAVYDAAPTGASLRNLFTGVLQHEGYTVSPTTRPHQEGALIFYRAGVAAIFVLKLPRISTDSVPRPTLPGSELSRTDFQNRLSASNKQRLSTALTEYEIIYLVGGVQRSPTQTPTLFLVREG